MRHVFWLFLCLTFSVSTEAFQDESVFGGSVVVTPGGREPQPGDPAVLPKPIVDSSFHFADTNITNIFDIELFPDGRIAYAGIGTAQFGTVGTVAPSGELLGFPFSGYSFQSALSISIDPREGAMFATGVPDTFSTAAVWRVLDFDDPWAYFNGLLQGTGSKVFLLPSREVLVAGRLTIAGDTNQFYGIGKFDNFGTLSTEFSHTNFAGIEVTDFAVGLDGAIMAAYRSTNETGVANGFARWSRDGERNESYGVSWLAEGGTNGQVSVIRKAPGTNGFIAAVKFAGSAGPTSKLVELAEDGEFVRNLVPSIQGEVNAIAFEVVRPSTAMAKGYDRVLIGGAFSGVGPTPFRQLAGIDRTGQAVWGFAPDEGPDSAIYAVETYVDGKVLIGGTFTRLNGVAAGGMARLNIDAGQTYLFWADEQFRGFEKDGSVPLKLVRSGKTDEALTVSIAATGAAPGSRPALPDHVEFAPGQTVADLSASVLNDDLRENRRLYDLSVVTATNVLVTRPLAKLVVLDDETAGTLSQVIPKWHYQFNTLALQDDGKILLGGWASSIVRLHPDGSLDSTFVTNGLPALTPNFAVHISQVQAQPNGKIYVAGAFNTTNGFGNNFFARLNADGTLDRTFDPRILYALSQDSESHPIFGVLEDETIVLWLPNRLRIEGVLPPPDGLYRLDTTGKVVTTYPNFQPWSSAALIKPLESGEFLLYAGGLLQPNIIKFASRVKDTNFVVSVPPVVGNGYVYAMEAVGDALYLAGSFQTVNGMGSPYIAKVDLQTGNLDTNFNTRINGEISAMSLGRDKLYISGHFDQVNDRERVRLARLNLDGSLDESFDPGWGPNSPAGLIRERTDGKIWLGSTFSRFDGIDLTPPSLVLLEGDAAVGTVDFVSRRIAVNETNGVARFEVERSGGSKGALSVSLESVQGSALQGVDFLGTNLTVTFGDGEFGRKVIEIPVLQSAGFSGARTFLVRMTAGNHSEDAAVLIQDSESGILAGTATVTGGTNAVRDIAAGPDGSLYVAGDFTAVNGFAITNLARLDRQLLVDTNFTLAALPKPVQSAGNPTNELYAPIESIAVRTNGSVVFSGAFVEIGGSNWTLLAQTDSNGMYDVDFIRSNMTSFGVSTVARELLLYPDGRLLVNNKTVLRRLLPNGTRDTSFGNSFLGDITKTVLHADETMFVVRSTSSVVRVTASNQTFQSIASVQHRSSSGLTLPAAIRDMAIAADGSLLIGGDFTHVNNVLAPRLAKVSTNGVVDTNFNAQVGISGLTPRDTVTALEVLPGGDIMIGGKFSEVQGKPRASIALLSADGELRGEFNPVVEGTEIREFESMPDGTVIGFGSVSSIDGQPVGQIFKMAIPSPRPPLVEILWPTNGTEVVVTDAVVPFGITVKAFDVDGFLESVVVQFDGNPVATNSSGGTLFIDQPLQGDHVITVSATDEMGLESSSTIRFHVTFRGFPGQITVRKSQEEVLIEYSGGRLQASTDLRTWVDVHTGGGVYSINGAAPYQFYREAL